MSELRQNNITGAWVVIAPRRGERPHDVAHDAMHASDDGASCPFCPGYEDQLTEILAEYPSEVAPGWSVRVISNLYPAFRPNESVHHLSDGKYVAQPAFGYQEVIIESPRHDADLATLSDAELTVLMRAYHDRFKFLISLDGIETVTLFRNHGAAGGASLSHPHSQIIATGLRPPRLQALDNRAGDHFERTGNCSLCDEMKAELAVGLRIVEACDAFVTFVPFAAQHPFEMWIVPLKHQSRFDAMNEAEVEQFGLALRGALRRLRLHRGDVAYHFAVDCAGRSDSASPHLHWQLRIAPRIAPWGGFELGTGIVINPVSPEQAAMHLRKVGRGE